MQSSGYGTESGRAGGAVVNIVTKSGTNQWHGSTFYFLRDSEFGGAAPAFVGLTPGFHPKDQQHQFGGTLGGRSNATRHSFLSATTSIFFMCPQSCSSRMVRRWLRLN